MSKTLETGAAVVSAKVPRRAGTKTRDLWRDERLGLAMIGASLLVIGVIVALMVVQQRESELARIRAQATSVIHLLRALPSDALDYAAIPGAIARSQSEDELAYAVVADQHGAIVQRLARAGIVVPPAAPSAPAPGEVAERAMALDDAAETRVIEFEVALFDGAEPAGVVRLGYLRPGISFDVDQLPFFASLALAIFLLTPIFYFLVRREIRPIRTLTVELERAIEERRLDRIGIDAADSVTELAQTLNGFARLARNRLAELEAENTHLLTSGKLLGYQKQRLERVLEALPDAVLLLDESGAAAFANAKLRGLLGVSPEDVMGRTTEEWCKERAIIDFIDRCEGKSLARQLTESIEFSPTESPNKTYSLRVSPLLSAHGPSVRSGTLLVFRDVTAEHLAASSRGEFVAHLAHELKTPLNVLAMYSESLQYDDDMSEAARIEAVNAISDEVERLAALIDNLLSITRIEMGSLKLERSRVNLKDLLQDAFDHVRRSGRGQALEFVLEVPDSLPAASLDKGLLRVALNNLLTNAIKYSNPGGTVTLSADETADLLRISVSDTGIGIRPEDRERIFERFVRADDEQTRSRAGHGLGLSLARDIVHLHHGVIRVESELGQGSKFSIELWKDSALLQQAS